MMHHRYCPTSAITIITRHIRDSILTKIIDFFHIGNTSLLGMDCSLLLGSFSCSTDKNWESTSLPNDRPLYSTNFPLPQQVVIHQPTSFISLTKITSCLFSSSMATPSLCRVTLPLETYTMVNNLQEVVIFV